MKRHLLAGVALALSFAGAAWAETYTLVLQPTNGFHIPRVLGASGNVYDSTNEFTGFDYFEWFGITHHRYWFGPGFSSLNPSGGVTNVAGFDAATAAVRANPWRQGTSADVYYDWNYFKKKVLDAHADYILQRFRGLGIVPMLVNTALSGRAPLVDWGNKFKYWKAWYAYVYYFASQCDITMYELSNEPNANPAMYETWESHWLVCADAVRKAVADVNRDYGKHLEARLCGPTTAGAYWNYSLPTPREDIHGWGTVAWKKIHTDIYGNEDPALWNFGMYDYHRYTPFGYRVEGEFAGLRQAIAQASNAPNATIPLLVTEYNTGTGAKFTTSHQDTEDPGYGPATGQLLQATATQGTNGLGDEGGFFLFKLGQPDGVHATLQNKTAYTSAKGDRNYGGVTRGGVAFQMYARHFRGGKPVLGARVTSGSDPQRRAVGVLDEQKRGYYVYFSDVTGHTGRALLDLGALEVQAGAPVTVARLDANSTGQITDYLTVPADKKITFNVLGYSCFLVWIPKGNSAGRVVSQAPADDTYLVVGEGTGNHGMEPTMKVSLHHASVSERRLAFLQFGLGAVTRGNRYLLRLSGHNIGTEQGAREILHVYGRPGGGWTSTNLSWAGAPGVGKYYTNYPAKGMSTTSGQGSLVDIEDNYAGLSKGSGLGLYGKFLGPTSFYSADWQTSYLDVTDYVRSLVASNQQAVTFILARIVRYDVNQYSNATYYAKGVYESDGRIVELGARENSNPAYRPALVVWGEPGAETAGSGAAASSGVRRSRAVSELGAGHEVASEK